MKKRNDLLLILGLFLAAALLFLVFRLTADAGRTVRVTVAGAEYGRYSLQEERRVEITDPDGNVTNVLRISDGYAWMENADCPDKLCEHMGKIHVSGETIVCLPNRVTVTVLSGGEGVDAVT